MAKRPVKKDVTEVSMGGVPPYDLSGMPSPLLPEPPELSAAAPDLPADPLPVLEEVQDSRPESISEELARKTAEELGLDGPNETDREQGESAYPDPTVREWHRLIYQLEASVRTGHGGPYEKDLMGQAAALIRQLLGVESLETLLYPDPPAYGPVANAPPIGHSLK